MMHLAATTPRASVVVGMRAIFSRGCCRRYRRNTADRKNCLENLPGDFHNRVKGRGAPRLAAPDLGLHLERGADRSERPGRSFHV